MVFPVLTAVTHSFDLSCRSMYSSEMSHLGFLNTDLILTCTPLSPHRTTEARSLCGDDMGARSVSLHATSVAVINDVVVNGAHDRASEKVILQTAYMTMLLTAS